MELLPLVLTSGWASGINAYAVITMLGLLGRYGGLDQVPDSLQNPAVLIIAGGLFLVEFVTDKIPYVDTAWDTISTFIRPTLAAMLGYLFAGQADTLGEAADQWWYAFLGGGAALASHLVKMGIRLGVNASPEPVTNVTVSLGEDITVVADHHARPLPPLARARDRRAALRDRHHVGVRALQARPPRLATVEEPRDVGAAELRGHAMSEAPEDMVRLDPWERHLTEPVRGRKVIVAFEVLAGMTGLVQQLARWGSRPPLLIAGRARHRRRSRRSRRPRW